MSKKIIIVGGVAAGATAAARLRRLDENCEILLVEKGEYISFANCGLPYYIGEVIKERDSLFVTDIETVKNKYNIEIRNFSEVISVDRHNKEIIIKDVLKDNTYSEKYDELILATGSTPNMPKIKGIDNKNVFSLWNIEDTDKIYNYISKNSVKNAVIVGGGFIGIELAENLKEKGINVSLVEFSNQILNQLDKDISMIIEKYIKEKGINLLLQKGVTEIKENGKKVILSDNDEIDSDLIIFSTGIRPNTKFLENTGILLNEKGGVVVDEFMRTNDENIYAVGDMIEIVNKVSGEKTMIPLAGPANKQGRAVAANVLGIKKEKYTGSIGTSILKVFDYTVANVGLNEKTLLKKGLKIWKDYGYVLIHSNSHASYYPKSLALTIKLLFEMNGGKVLGAQIFGYDGVDKRIDVISTAISFNANVYDLTKLDLAYAPPFSSAKDPVNLAGYYASDILEGLSTPISYEDYLNNKDEYELLDIRENIEKELGEISNSKSIPLTELRKRYNELDENKKYVVYCAIGLRGYIAERILKQKGYKVYNLLGGFRTYEDYKEDVEVKENMEIKNDIDNIKDVLELNVCGLSCPGPIVSVAKKMSELTDGDILKIEATDKGFSKDIDSWCKNTGNTLISKKENKGIYEVLIRKGTKVVEKNEMDNKKEKTMIVFDGDLDKALAAFIIANGSVAMGNKVNMFFTFWGLNILRKSEKVKVKKDLISKMFGFMMPKGSKKLGLSKMNFLGAGSKMMKYVMKEKGISSLEELIDNAIKSGVKIVACQMSMDVMGITKEELIDGIEIGGVATMLNDNDNSNMNLFI